MRNPCWPTLPQRTMVLLILSTLLLLVPGSEGKFGRGGGGRARASSSSGWGSRSSSSSHRSSGSSKGNWFTNLFIGSKVSSAANTPSVSKTNTQTHHSYPKQPAHNPYYDQPPPYSHVGRPPSYGSLYPHSSFNKPNTFAGSNYGSSQNGGIKTFQPQPSQQNVFPMFTPQTQNHNSYHFIPFIYPMHGSYHHYHGGSGASRYGSASTTSPLGVDDNIGTGAVTPAPITNPIIYDLNTGSTENKLEKPSLVVVVNNMVIYGEMVDDQHIVMIINEDFEQPNDIPHRFLLPDTENEDDIELNFSWMEKSSSTTSPLQSTTNTVLSNSKNRVFSNETQADAVGKIDASQVLNNHWFSDVDGGNK